MNVCFTGIAEEKVKDMIHESKSGKTATKHLTDVVTSVFAYSEFVCLKLKNGQSFYM